MTNPLAAVVVVFFVIGATIVALDLKWPPPSCEDQVKFFFAGLAFMLPAIITTRRGAA